MIDEQLGDLLQAYYPVRRQNEEGKIKSLYVHRQHLEEFDVKAITKRMRKANTSLEVHADALEAWFYGKTTVA